MADVILKEVGAILENAEQSGLALTKNEILSLKVFHHVLQVSGLVPPPPPLVHIIGHFNVVSA